jgi:soluble lytic murein transglycosylase-like protein
MIENPAMMKHQAVEATFYRSVLKAIILFVLVLAGGSILVKPVQAMHAFLYASDTTRLSRINEPAGNLATRSETSQVGRAVERKESTNSLVKRRPANQSRIITQSKSASTFRGQRFSTKEVEALIRDSAKKYGLPVDKVLRIARCESKLDHTVISRNGTYWGVYQFNIRMWNNMPEGKAKIDRRDAIVNINVAHRHMKAHGYSAWGCK